jgi:hypothetical protein
MSFPLWRGFAPVVAFGLLGLFFCYQLEKVLIDRYPLRKPEPSVPYYMCRHLFPLITDHGKFHKCYREGV